MLKKSIVLLLIFTLLSAPSYAKEYNPIRKIARGITNISLCWLEFFIQPFNVMERDGHAAGIFYGPAKGIMFTVGRVILGGYEIATFLLPPYKPLVEPEFVIPEDGVYEP